MYGTGTNAAIRNTKNKSDGHYPGVVPGHRKWGSDEISHFAFLALHFISKIDSKQHVPGVLDI